MRYLICYDIEDDRQRSRIARVIEGYGQRVQKSVFECQLSPRRLEELKQHLERIFEPRGGDTIRIYPLCADCYRMAEGIGDQPPNSTNKIVFIDV